MQEICYTSFLLNSCYKKRYNVTKAATLHLGVKVECSSEAFCFVD